MRAAASVFPFLALAACSERQTGETSTPARGPAFPPAENVKVDITITRDPKEVDAFNLSDAQAADFLNSADIVSGREIHDFHDIIGNVVSGTAEMRGLQFRWSIDQGGTGTLTRELDGDVFRIADPGKRNANNLAD